MLLTALNKFIKTSLNMFATSFMIDSYSNTRKHKVWITFF